jgi:hypothetical protein
MEDPLFQICNRRAVRPFDQHKAVNGPKQIAQIAEPVHRHPHPPMLADGAILPGNG